MNLIKAKSRPRTESIPIILIPEDEPEEDEKELVDEKVKAEDYTPLEDILEKYE